MKKPLLSEMTLREKIGQCLLPYQTDLYLIKKPDGTDIDRPEEEMRAIIEKNQFGTIWADQIVVHSSHMVDLSEESSVKVKSDRYKALLDKQSSMGKIPALRSLDAEQGAGKFCSDASIVPAGISICAADSEELAYKQGASIAKEVRTLGANWRWSPVVDMVNDRCMSVLRTSIQGDVDRGIAIANAQIRGMQDQGVAATAKHFPGHDPYEYRDAHFTDTVIRSSMDEWWAEQGKAFQGVIDGGVYSVMIGHTAFPACDDTKVKGKYIPSTVSKKVITDLLKGEMGFKGVVVTDGIVMAGLFNMFNYEDLIVNLINAGNDVLLGVFLEAGDIIEKAVLDGRIKESRIDDACTRVLDMKEKLGMFNDGYDELPYTMKEASAETAWVNKEIAEANITLIRDNNSMLPLDAGKIKHATVICSSHTEYFMEDMAVFKKELEARGIEVHMQRRLQSIRQLEEFSKETDLIIYAGLIAAHAPKGGMAFFGEEFETYQYAFTSGKDKSIGVAFGYPYIHYDIMGNAETFINAYNRTPEAMKAVVKGIFGEIEIKGKSPRGVEPSRRLW